MKVWRIMMPCYKINILKIQRVGRKARSIWLILGFFPRKGIEVPDDFAALYKAVRLPPMDFSKLAEKSCKTEAFLCLPSSVFCPPLFPLESNFS
jgi:hypothetical protein